MIKVRNTQLVTILLFTAATTIPAMAKVKLIERTDRSFVLQTGEYIVKYAPFESKDGKAWVTIAHRNKPDTAIGTKLANGHFFDITSNSRGSDPKLSLSR